MTIISLLVWLYVAALFVLIGAFYRHAARAIEATGGPRMKDTAQ